MKTPKEQRMEQIEKSAFAPQWGTIVVCVLIAAVIVVGLVYFIESRETDAQRTTREATAFMSTVQPGDTLYWFRDGGVRPLAIRRNLVGDRVVRANGITYQYQLVGDAWMLKCDDRAEQCYSYNEVYQFLVTVVEKP